MTKIALAALASVGVGVFLGAVYDVFRLFRVILGITAESPFGKKGVRPYVNWILCAACDLLYMAVCAVCMCVFFFLTGDGRMRSYGLIGAFCGFEAYYHTIGRLFISLAVFSDRKFKSAVRKALSLIMSAPFVQRGINKYKEFNIKTKQAAAIKKRKKQMAKCGSVKNGF
ncbi:MAG: spore cortex biosynthesis protein YabQ [Clostridia bacterium]|nr:spore cortex biosynthesis protein YabQ [Clostridia bacterium]